MNDAMESISSVSGIQFVDRGDDNDDELKFGFTTLMKNHPLKFGFVHTWK